METAPIALVPRAGTYQIIIVEVPAAWRPTDWRDTPATHTLVEIVARNQTRAAAEGWLFGYNSLACADGQLWAVMSDDVGPFPIASSDAESPPVAPTA